jgi:hypothetical protein
MIPTLIWYNLQALRHAVYDLQTAISFLVMFISHLIPFRDRT